MNITLTDWLTAGRYLDVLLSDPAALLIGDYVISLQQQQQQHQQQQQQQPAPPPQHHDGGYGDSSGSKGNSAAVSAQDRLAVGLAAFNAFLQGNVTGPVLEAKGLRQLESRFLKSEGSDGGDGNGGFGRYREMR